MSVLLLKFGAIWCSPCRVMEKLIHRVAPEFPGIQVVNLDVDDDAEQALRHGIRSVPTVVVQRDGAEVDRWVGAMPEASLREKFKRLL